MSFFFVVIYIIDLYFVVIYIIDLYFVVIYIIADWITIPLEKILVGGAKEN